MSQRDKKKKVNREEIEDPGGGMGPGAPSGGGGGGGNQEYDPEEVRRMVEQSVRTRSVANQNHFTSRRAWQEYLHALPQDVKAEYKGGQGGRDRELDRHLRRGDSFESTGIKNVHEEGQARYRRMGMHNLDKSFTYDWENGVKYNVATSDDAAYMKPIPLSPEDYQEKAEIDRYGATPEGYAQRMRDATTNQLGTWARQNEAKGGSLRRDDHGFYMSGDDGGRIDFDAYGNLIDANTGQRMGDMVYGEKGNITGYAAQMGYKSPWALPGGAAQPGVGGPPGMPADSPSASSGVPSGPPPVVGPGGGMGTAPPSAMMTPTEAPLTSMGNSWNRQAVGQMKPQQPTQQPRALPGQRSPMQGGGMGAAPSTMRSVSGGVNNRQGSTQQPRRITFAY